MDRKPQVRIEIDKSAIESIDSLVLVTNTYFGVEKQSEKVLKDTKEYVLSNKEDVGTIILKLKDKSEIKLDSIKLNITEKLIISETNGTYTVGARNYSEISRFLIVFFISLIIVFSLKVTAALLIIKPNSTQSFILTYILFNSIYIFILVLLTNISNGIILLCLVFFVGIFVEFSMLFTHCRKGGIARPIISVIVGNLLVFTIGAGLFFIITAQF